MTDRSQMIQRVGEDLSLVPIGQALESQDLTRIGSTFDEIYEKLKEKGLASWATNQAVPDKLVPYFALMMEEKLLITYSVSDAKAQRILLQAGEGGVTALEKISELNTQQYEDTHDETDF